MKTISFTIKVKEEQEVKIKDTIQGKIAYHLEQKELSKKQVGVRVKELFDIRDTLMQQLNDEVGENVWFFDDNGTYHPRHEKGMGVTIGFRDGVYKNTPYNDWDIYITTPMSEKIEYGEISYQMPKLDEIRLYISSTEKNERSRPSITNYIEFTDLNEVHKLLENDYKTYFTRKAMAEK